MIRRENYLMVQKYLKSLLDKPTTKANSVERYEFYLNHLLLWADDKPFYQAFRMQNGDKDFIHYVSRLPGRNGVGIAVLSSQKKIIETAKNFLKWFATEGHPEGKKIDQKILGKLVAPRIVATDAEPEYVSLEDVIALCTRHEFRDNLALWRDQAAAAFAYLSAARAGAIVTAPICAVNLDRVSFYQYPELGVATKNGKKAETFLLPIPELLDVVRGWDSFIRSQLPPTALWYTPIQSEWGEQTLSVEKPGENRAGSLGDRFEKLYAKVGMADQYKSPHKFRHGHALYSLERCDSMARYQDISRNLMHSNIAITDQVYAVREKEARRETVMSLVPSKVGKPDAELETYLTNLCPTDRKRAMRILVEMTM